MCKRPTWRLYAFKGDAEAAPPIPLTQTPFYLFGKDRRVVDIPTDHPSCSRQHAVIVFRCAMDDAHCMLCMSYPLCVRCCSSTCGPLAGRAPLLQHRVPSAVVCPCTLLPAAPLCTPAAPAHCSLLHREVEADAPDGLAVIRSIKPYLLDLESMNGTTLNKERLEPARYYELLHADVVRFGNSSREYVIMNESNV